MDFSVATNFQDNFIQKLNKKEVSEIYGTLTSDFTGSGRMSYMLPSVSKKKLRQHIKEAHENGLQFNYPLNTVCLTGREFTLQGQKKLQRLLDYLESVKIDSVTVALPFLLKLTKKKISAF